MSILKAPIEFQGLNGYCMGVPKIKDFSRFLNKQLMCSTSTLIHIKKSIKPQITTKNGILVSPSIVRTSFFNTIVDILWFWGWVYHSMIHKLF
jgi:hypothetical protein